MSERRWKHHLRIKDIWRDDDLSWETKRDAVVAKIKKLPHYQSDDELIEIVEMLEEATFISEFDEVWDQFYDWADWNRVWVETL